MTVPKSKILSVSKGIMALADLKHNSPEVSQYVVVNVSANKEPVKVENGMKTREVDGITVVPASMEGEVKYDPNANPYLTGDSSVEYLKSVITEKENMAKASSMYGGYSTNFCFN